jgi:enoyl-CoA hydratase
MSSKLIVQIEPPIAHLTVHRPERRNALDHEVLDALLRALDAIERTPDLRAVILTGAGDQAFIAGGDLKELRALRTHEEALSMNRRFNQALRRLELLDCAVIVAINGVAIGGGCEVTLVGDRRLMASEATLTFRQATLGLTCGWGGMTRLERLVGRSRAFQILLMEETISAERALALGLVDEVVPREALLERAGALARSLSELPPLALRSIKRGLARVGEMPFERALEYEAELFARTWSSEDHWEAMDAFFAGRPPDLKGR